jgi:hypothetical protein
MATVSFVHIGNITSLPAGVTTHWSWNNAAAQKARAISVDAIVPTNIPPQVGETASFQVTAVEYREIYHGGTTFEKEIHFWIKNTGTITANFAVHMAIIGD